MTTESKKVPFRQWQIRVIRTYDGKIRVALADLCMIIKREEILKTENLTQTFPTAIKIPFRKNGQAQWSIHPVDMHRLLQPVRKESSISRELADELEEWGNRLLETESPQHPVSEYKEIIRHYKDDFPVTFRVFGNRIMVNATQITMKFGKIPSEWLRISATDALRREMERNGQLGKYDTQLFTTRGRGHGATWLEAPLVVFMAKWIAPDTDLAEWYRKQLGTLGFRAPRAKASSRQAMPDTLACLENPLPEDLKEAREMIMELRSIIKENLPKITFYEEFIENRDWFKSTRIADELGISPYNLHQFLAEQGICKYEKRQWVVFGAYRALQCDVPYTWTNNKGKAYTFGSTKRWTQAGREYILELWKQQHPENTL